VSHAIHGIGLEKRFSKRRSLRELARKPFARAERVHALRGVDLAVDRGEIFGLLGPNGAGKTTLLKIFSCLVLPDAGRAEVDGIDTVHENRVKRRLGLVNSDERSFYWRLTGWENLQFFARIYDVPGPRIEARIGELLDRVDMREAAGRRFAEYSSGMKQRMAVARALLHDPPILLMDEPTRSLDPVAAMALRGFIRDELQRREGKTIILASHDLHEVESLADRVGFIVRGRVRRTGTVAEIKRWGLSEKTYEVVLAADARPLSGPFRIVADETVEGQRRLRLALPQAEPLEPALRALLAAGVSLRSIHEVEADLEQAFARIIGAAEDEP